MKITLEVTSGPMDGHVFQFNQHADLGREGQLKIEVDRFISRRHARLQSKHDSVMLEDLGSTNGTFVDGERLNGSTQLNNRQFFRIGRTWLYISW